LADIPAQLAEALRDRYVLERELGRGGMAMVYLAHDLKHDRPVALKVLRAEPAATLGPDRFRREIHLAARLQHPHILTVLDSGDTAGQLWFTMPYVEGQSLRDRLRREHQLPVEDALRITREAAAALGYAHQHGVVHRDVKPENILLTTDGTTLVADFGIARALGGGAEHLTETGMVVGTPTYMSPEQAAGDTNLDARTDVYALGCVLYEMLAGEPPYTGPTAQAIIAKHFSDDVPRVRRSRPAVPEHVERAITRALAPTAADRFQTATEFARTLGSDASVPPGRAPRRSRRPLVLRTGAVLAVLAIGYLGLRLTGRLPSRSLVAEGALAPRDQLVLSDFANKANDSSLASAVTEAFLVDFAQSRLVGLASRDRIRQALRRMQRPDTLRLTLEIAREVAVREGLKAVLAGEVSRVGDAYIISAQLIGADSGQVLAAYRETARSAGEVIPAIDRVSRELRRRIGEPLRRVQAGPPLKVVTTGSLDALRQYSLGSRAFEAGRYEEAISLWEEAVRLDTAFAMAWRGIATALWNMGRDPARQQETLTRAFALRDRLTERERYGTEALYYDQVLDDRTRARAAYRSLLALDPAHAGALTNLGLLAWFDGDLAEAAEMAGRAIRADSTAVQPYSNLVDAQVTLGRLSAAETTLARWRDRLGPLADYEAHVAFLASIRGQYDSAGRVLRRVAESTRPTADRALAAGMLAALDRVQGRLADAYRRDEASAELEGTQVAALRAGLNQAAADVYVVPNGRRAAKRLASLLSSRTFAAVPVTDRPYDEIAFLYAMAGEAARATGLFDEGERVLRAAGAAGEYVLRQRWHRMWRDAVQGAVLLHQGKFEEAATNFKRASSVFPYTNWLAERGTALDRAGHADSALAVYEQYLASTFNFRLFADANNLAPTVRRVGELYEARGDRVRAAQAYQRFVDLWRTADPELQPQVLEIKRRLAGVASEAR
jgi:serine/threonine protein kinase/tetratricopeptide (TPR) repeat protein